MSWKQRSTIQLVPKKRSINGNAIYRQKYNALNGANMTDMDVSSLSAGIYLLQVVTPRGIKTMKFIKQ